MNVSEPRIVISVRGGVVESVCSNTALDADIFDFDDHEGEADADDQLDRLVEGIDRIY